LKRDSKPVSQSDEVVFFGRVVASVSHELSNVISTIHQVCGLLEDLIAGSERGQPVSAERLKMIYGRLSRQTSRGIEVIQNLNRFAHNVDERPVQFEVNRVIGNLMVMARRFAELKDVQLEVAFSPEEIPVVGDPFCLQQVVFLVLDRALETAARDDILKIIVDREASGPAVRILPPKPTGLVGNDSEMESLRALAGKIRGTISFRMEEGGSELILLEVPRSQAANLSDSSDRL